MRLALFALALFLLCGCVPQTEVVVSDANEPNSANAETLASTLESYYSAARSDDPSSEALERLNENLTRQIEGKKADVNLIDSRGRSPLRVAAEANDRAMIARLCKAGANYDARTTHRIPLLTLALQEGALESAKALLACGANANAAADVSPAPLTIAVLGGITSVDYRSMAIELLDGGADPNLGAIGEHSLLLYSIKTSQSDLARKMIEKGADTELADEDGMTPLAWAILLRDDETANALLSKGASREAIDAHGYTPLSWAIFVDNRKAVALLAADPNVKVRENDRGTLAAQAAKNRTLAELRSLVAGGSLAAKAVETSEPINLPSIARFKNMEFLTLEYGGETIAFKTSDALLRDFLLENPSRLVLDFSRASAAQSFTMPLDPKGVFRQISVGRHTGSYRVVILLDKPYNRYDLERTADGPVVSLR
jgi:ankyrin repeat protein